MEINRITEQIIGAAIEVHKHLGPGLFESVYQQCLAHELQLRNINFEREKVFPVNYKGKTFDNGYRFDFLVEELIIVELKSIKELQPIHTSQLITYLKLSGLQVGLLINFNVKILKHGIKRIIV